MTARPQDGKEPPRFFLLVPGFLPAESTFDGDDVSCPARKVEGVISGRTAPIVTKRRGQRASKLYGDHARQPDRVLNCCVKNIARRGYMLPSTKP